MRETLRLKKERDHIFSALICAAAAVLFLTSAFFNGKNAENFSDIITIQSHDGTFLQREIDAVMQDEQDIFTAAAWTEKKLEQVQAEMSGRTDTADVILLRGESRCVLPWGENLPGDDADGCIIGRELAKSLFGSVNVKNQQIQYGERTLFVRGVVDEPGRILLCQASEGERFTRISIVRSAGHTKTLPRTAAEFMNRYGLNAHILYFNRIGSLSWILELVPGKWSDFSGWRQNGRQFRQENEFTKQCQKSAVESLYLEWIKRRNTAFFAGIVFLSIAGRQLWRCGGDA